MTDYTTTALATTGITALQLAGQVANAYAQRGAFVDYQKRKAPNTLLAQRADLAKLAAYLADAGIPTGGDFYNDPHAWAGVTWGLVEGFREWQMQAGASITTVNRTLSTVKKYAQLAAKAGAISPGEMTLIKTVNGYGGKEAKRADEKRTVTRTGTKKAAAVMISPEQAKLLKTHPDTPQGRRDALLMCLLLDHGLRVGELVRLEVTDFDLKAGTMNFYRPKVDKTQTHKLTADTLRALRAWVDCGDCPAMGPVLRGSRKGGTLTGAGISERCASERVRTLGAAIGIAGLSAHDCRHCWATWWAGRVDLFRLQEAGGWNSLAMPRRYTEWASVANDGMA